MYKLYSISRNNGIKTCVFDCSDDGEIKEGSLKYIDTYRANFEIQEARYNNLKVIKLPIDTDSDFYDKYIVYQVYNKFACIKDYSFECGGGKTSWYKGNIYDSNAGHIGLSGSSLSMHQFYTDFDKHFFEIKNDRDSYYFQYYAEAEAKDIQK